MSRCLPPEKGYAWSDVSIRVTHSISSCSVGKRENSGVAGSTEEMPMKGLVEFALDGGGFVVIEVDENVWPGSVSSSSVAAVRRRQGDLQVGQHHAR
jgi:hypothetical protein